MPLLDLQLHVTVTHDFGWVRDLLIGEDSGGAVDRGALLGEPLGGAPEHAGDQPEDGGCHQQDGDPRRAEHALGVPWSGGTNPRPGSSPGGGRGMRLSCHGAPRVQLKPGGDGVHSARVVARIESAIPVNAGQRTRLRVSKGSTP